MDLYTIPKQKNLASSPSPTRTPPRTASQRAVRDGEKLWKEAHATAESLIDLRGKKKKREKKRKTGLNCIASYQI